MCVTAPATCTATSDPTGAANGSSSAATTVPPARRAASTRGRARSSPSASSTNHARGPMRCARSFSDHETLRGVTSRPSSVKTRAHRPYSWASGTKSSSRILAGGAGIARP